MFDLDTQFTGYIQSGFVPREIKHLHYCTITTVTWLDQHHWASFCSNCIWFTSTMNFPRQHAIFSADVRSPVVIFQEFGFFGLSFLLVRRHWGPNNKGSKQTQRLFEFWFKTNADFFFFLEKQKSMRRGVSEMKPEVQCCSVVRFSWECEHELTLG